MSELSKYEAQVKKMQGLCDEHGLVYKFNKAIYPITFIIRPTQGIGEQLSMLEAAEEDGYTSPEAYMKWAFQNNELRQVVDGGAFTIDVTLRKKIETILLKMITFWLQFFFRDVIEKGSLKYGMMPVIDENEADDHDVAQEDEEEEEHEDEIRDDQDGDEADADEALIGEAIQIVRVENKATVALLQRRMNIGYAQAARILDSLEEQGIIGPYNGYEPREVLPFDAPEDEAAG